MNMQPLFKSPKDYKLVKLSGKNETIIFCLFAVAYLGKLLEKLFYSFGLVGRSLDFAESYAATEWLINYSSGFIRRGLPGEVIHFFYRIFAVPPFLSIVLLSVSIYGIYFFLVWRLSQDIIPRWALLATPLLGFPVYVEKIFLRKDIFILLMIAVVYLLLARVYSLSFDIFACVILTLLVISHEVGFFLALVPAVFLMILRELPVNQYGHVAVHPGRATWMNEFILACKKALPSLGLLLIPITAFLAVFTHSGTVRSANLVALSWKSAYDKSLPFPGPTGPLYWLGRPAQDQIAMTQSALAERYAGIPFWLILVFAITTSIVLVAMTISLCSRADAWFFVCCAVLQFICMAPVVYSAVDFIRWVALSTNAAFLLTIIIPSQWREAFCKLFPVPSFLVNLSFPDYVAAFGLAFWGFQLGPLSLYGWLSSSPAGFILQVYFYLRVLGWLPDLGRS